MSQNGRTETAVRWWENPLRKCLNDIRFTELPRGRNAKAETAELIYLCYQCPVIKECHKDAALERKRYPTTDVVQGGELWLS